MNIFFVPIKRAKKASKSQNHLEGSIAQAVELVKEVVAKDPTNQLINFMKEEMEKARQHELQLIQMLMQPSGPSTMPMQFTPIQSAGHFQQVPSHTAPPYRLCIPNWKPILCRSLDATYTVREF